MGKPSASMLTFSRLLALSCEKIKADVFDGPQMKQLLPDEEFLELMSDAEKEA